MSPNWIQLASIIMFLGVALGAFAAHGLKSRLTEYGMDIFKTAVLYQFIHGLALFILAWLSTVTQSPKIGYAGAFFLAGIVFFSGSLYILAITNIRWMGAITPLGGICFLIGWVLLLGVKL